MKRIWMLSVAALLAACSGGPGNGDVEKALAVYFKEATGTTMTFEGLKVGECVRGAVRLRLQCHWNCAVSAGHSH